MQAKYTYEENEVVSYIFGDHKQKFFTVLPPFFQDDMGVSIGSNFKEKKKKDMIDSAASQAFSNAQTPELILQLIEVLDSENSNESKKILKQGLKALEKIRQENNACMEAQAKAAAESEQQKIDKEHAL